MEVIRTFVLVLLICVINGENLDTLVTAGYSAPNGVTEHPGGIITDGIQRLSRAKSPYWLRSDLIIEKNAELVIEPGVEVRFEPMIGITVRGILTAVGKNSEQITLTSSKDNPIPAHQQGLPEIRLVDGPTVLSGRVQLKHRGQWRSVCTNSRNWTQIDMETACRQLGFQGGYFFQWYNREMPLKPRLLYEEPKCEGKEANLFHCQWKSRQLGSGVCDYHPDLGIQCLPRHDTALPFWRGIKFENAQRGKVLSRDNILYVPTSKSKLSFVNIKYAGSGRNYNATSALHIEGVPPVLKSLQVSYSAYNGINITAPEGPIKINDCVVRNNRGYGIFINSTYGLASIDGCNIIENGADGVKYIHAEDRPDERPDRSDMYEFCTLAITTNQIYPIQIYTEQSRYAFSKRVCSKTFFTREGRVLTLNFIRSETDRNNSAKIEVYDGTTKNDKLLTSFYIRNNTRPQSITTTSNKIYIVFTAEEHTQMLTYMKLTAGVKKSYDMIIQSAYIVDNNGRGVAFDNLRSQLRVHNSTISNNNHIAGIHVTSGVGDINITDSRVSFNDGDGINITYTGGNRNISRSMISSNKGYGIAIWLNDTKETEFIFHNQTTVVQYSEIVKNLETGILHGNYCGDSYVNITDTKFLNSPRTSLEILSCWKPSQGLTKLQIGHNSFIQNEQLAIKISPALNLDGKIEFNHFKKGLYGALLIKNKPLEEFNILKTNLLVQENNFFDNSGVFVVNLGLSPYSEYQNLVFYKNFVKNNMIQEPFEPEDGSISRLIPRTRVAAPLVISSNNVKIYRNILSNPHSNYEIGSHFEDQSKIINCTYNWLGSIEQPYIFDRIFHRNDRYNLAKIIFIPYLIHNSNPLTNLYQYHQTYVPEFLKPGTKLIGGEVEGQESLSEGEYVVERDINIRPGGKLVLEPGVTLKFPPSIGIMIGGKIEARGNGPNNIRFTLKEEIVMTPENDTYEIFTERMDENTEIIEIEPKVPIRLLGGKTTSEGRLQVKIENEWGTVCNYGWTMIDTALVCHQLGLVLNPNDWFLERIQIPEAGTTENILLTNVLCDEFDTDITKCKSDRVDNFENSCTHEDDVGVRCYESSWAGVRFGVLAERSDLQYMTIEKAGLLDYSTNQFKPALQIDFARHNLESIKVIDNFHDGIGVLYSDIYSADAENIVRNSELSRNKGSGISFKQLGMKIHGTSIENNMKSGIRHNPALSSLEQREVAGWFHSLEYDSRYKPVLIPQNDLNIYLDEGETKYLVTSRVQIDPIVRKYSIKCPPSFVLGIQLLNPIHNRSTESISILDTQTESNTKASKWSVNRDLSVFPASSSSYGVLLFYDSGVNALGGTVIAITTIRAPIQDIPNRIVRGPVPTLTLRNTRIKGNKYGIHASYYNRYLNEDGDHFLRKANETFKIFGCELSHNENEAIYINSPHWDIHESNISEITVMINNSLITDNGKGIYHFSRDMRSSNNLFHYVLQDNTIERNKAGGFEINLPYVWQYDENFTHSVYFNNNTWRSNSDFGISIDGHFARVNVTRNVFRNNVCKQGLFAIKGMEKKMLIDFNKIEENLGQYMIEFSSDSQSEILGEIFAYFIYNEIRNNKLFNLNRKGYGVLQLNNKNPSSVVRFNGIQKVKINRNLFTQNEQDYQLIAGIRTARVNNYLDVRFNWWDTRDEKEIQKKIFDFNDWNNHAVAEFKPYLTEDSVDSSFSDSADVLNEIDLDNLGGRLTSDLILHPRARPYIVKSDLTVMKDVKLTISPGVTMEFAPNVGILVLGILKAKGLRGYEITMRPTKNSQNLENKIVRRSVERPKRQLERMIIKPESIRLCQDRDCLPHVEIPNEGFMEYFNKTTLQWIPMCDPRFTERNAQVVCRELGFDPINAYFDFDIRIDYHSNSLSRIWSWPEPLQCSGTESSYEECPIRLNGQLYGHRHECKWNSKFVFIHCGSRNLKKRLDYWGGIRFAGSEFEQYLYAHRIHDSRTHTTAQAEESELEFVKIEGAGILHNEKSPAIQSIIKSPKVKFVNITESASHGINMISPSNNVELLFNNIINTLGVGINILSLTGEGQESDESSFSPLKNLNIPYGLFSLVDICDTAKVIEIEERILLYYKYDNHPVNCVKIFKSRYNAKPFGFRLLQFNLFNSTNKPGKHDSISLFDGDIYNVSATYMGNIEVGSKDEKKLFKTREPSLSVKLFANGASSTHGFIAEIVTLPISAIVFNRDIQHNISFSVLQENMEGAISYVSAGEVNPILTLDKNQFRENCVKLYGNFSTCPAAVNIDVQNIQTIYFRNNLIKSNQGGLSIKADSRGSATSLKGWIHNNLFVNNTNRPALYIEGRQSSPYQEVTIYRNYFTQNYAQYENTIVLKQVVSNFTYNYVKKNTGQNILEVSGFDKVRLPIYQSTSHNGFYKNYALNRDSRSTIVAGTAGQHYVDNIFFNPDNDYEMITVNRSLFNFSSSLDAWKTKIDAAHNYWGYNESLAVAGRIRDMSDDINLLEVTYTPYYMNNETILDGKCPPGWDLVGDTCYNYIGAPLIFEEAREFCRSDNASMPYILGNYHGLYQFLRRQQQWYHYSERVWVQDIDRINQCTMFAYQTIEIDNCMQKSSFICEIDPKIVIDPLSWRGDIVITAVIGTAVLAIFLILMVVGCWYSKSKYRNIQRLERRNSIRQSLNSLRSVGTNGGFSDMGYRRKAAQMSTRSTDTLTKGSDYKKMVSNGSIDSMEKSTFNSSIEDNQSYDIFEAHNPNPSGYSAYATPTNGFQNSIMKTQQTFTPKPKNEYTTPGDFGLAYRNEGFRDNSTFASAANSGLPSRSESIHDTNITEEMPIIHSPSDTHDETYTTSDYYNTDTLPLNSTLAQSDSTLDLKRDIDENNRLYDPDRPQMHFLQELKSKLPQTPKRDYKPKEIYMDLPTPPEPPPIEADYREQNGAGVSYTPDYNTVGVPLDDTPKSSDILETDLNLIHSPKQMPKTRAKSEVLLETNFDYFEPEDQEMATSQLTENNRSKSQPLETAM